MYNLSRSFYRTPCVTAAGADACPPRCRNVGTHEEPREAETRPMGVRQTCHGVLTDRICFSFVSLGDGRTIGCGV